MSFIPNLIIEVTRRCNLKCKHCLRGESQKNKVFKKKYLENLFKGVDDIGTITFTGGEPLLNVERIIEVLEYAYNNNVEINGFYIVSNGTIYSKKLITYLSNYPFGEIENCCFEISQDQYHNNSSKKQDIINKYQALQDYYGFDFINLDGRKKDIQIPINEGLAEENGVGGRDASYSTGFHKEYDEDDEMNDYYNDNMVYVSATGEVISDCDLSFKHVDEFSFGSLLENSLINIIELFSKNEPETIYI